MAAAEVGVDTGNITKGGVTYSPVTTTTTKTNTSSSAYTEQSGTTADNKIVVLKTLTDDGAGSFVGGMGFVNYAGKQVQAQMVDLSKSTTNYQSDHTNAKAFEQQISTGAGSSSGTNGKGGQYGTSAVSEEVLAGVQIKYRTGAGVPVHKTTTYRPPAMVIDLCPYTTDRIVPGSVQFRWMGVEYQDYEGKIYRGRTSVSPGIESGVMNYAHGTATMVDYVVGGTGPTDFVLQSLWTNKTPWNTASLFFNTEVAPLRPGPGGFVLSLQDLAGNTITSNVDAQGAITGLHMRGRVEFNTGGVSLQFGDYVVDAGLTPEEKAQWWYNAADVGAVEAGKIWRPWPVDPTSLRYSVISYVHLPVDVALMGLDPAALPADGRVPFVRVGDNAVIGVMHGGSSFPPFAGQTYNLGHTRLSWVQVLDAASGAEIREGYTHDLDAGTVTFTDTTGYPASIKVIGRTEVYRKIAEVRIDGRVRLVEPVGYGFDAGAVFSTALRQGDRFARVKRVYDQYEWDGIKWVDGLSGNQAPAEYNQLNNKIAVNNLGAITERFALRIRADGNSFDCYGQHIGLIAAGSINTDFAPINPATSVPYFVVPAGGWGSGWIPGNTLFIDTVGAEASLGLARCVRPGSPAGIDDSFLLVQRGDKGRPPESSFA